MHLLAALEAADEMHDATGLEKARPVQLFKPQHA
jgi:hypothetical protein